MSILLNERAPQCPSRDGGIHYFDMQVLRRFSASLLKDEDYQLPITIFFVSESRDACFVSDEVAALNLRRMEGFGEAYPCRDGGILLPNSLAYALIQRHSTAIQWLIM